MTGQAQYIVPDVVTIICFLICVYFVSQTAIRFSKTNINEPASKAMVSLSLTVVVLFMIHQIASIVDYSYSAATGKENRVLSIFGTIYALGRLCVYGIFINRLKFIVQGTFTSYPPCTIKSVYCIFIATVLSLVVGIFGFINGILILLYIGGFSFVLGDLALCILLPLLFVGKLYQLVEFHESISNPSKKNNHQSTSNTGDTTNTNDNNSNVTTSIQLGDTSNDPLDGKIETSVPSIAAIGATTENAPVNEDKNKYKYDTILFTASKISLLTCITVCSMVLILPISIALQSFGNNTWAGSIPEILIKIDEVVNIICICLCFKINDDWYMRLCSDGHHACQRRACYRCWLRCCYPCVIHCLE